eukprot:COSAG01_NODE_1068_length_11878_cov_45.012395_9_plen_42_part_00
MRSYLRLILRHSISIILAVVIAAICEMRRLVCGVFVRVGGE